MSQTPLPLSLPTLRPRHAFVSLAALPKSENLLCPAPAPDFVASIRDFMLVQPLCLREPAGAGGVFEVIDGRGRLKACQLIAEEIRARHQKTGTDPDAEMRERQVNPVPAVIFPAEFSEPAILAAQLNMQRRENLLTSLQAIRRWKEDPSVPEETFAHKYLHCTVGELRRLVRVLDLRAGLYAGLVKGEISQAVAFLACRLSRAQQADLEAVYQQTGRVRALDVAAVRQAGQAAAAAALPDSLFPAPVASAPPPPVPDDWILPGDVAATDPLYSILHELWTAAVSQPGYDKTKWQRLERLIWNVKPIYQPPVATPEPRLPEETPA